MPPTLPILALLASFLSHPAAQLLTTGNTALPACAASCGLVNQAVQACSGFTAASQATWICFCQSAYLTTLYTSPAGICDSTCTAASDAQQLMGWYQSNCGSDKGASEHPDGPAAATTVVVTRSASASGTATAAASTTAAASSGAAGTGAATASPDGGGSWWDQHKKWVIMIVVIVLGCALLALLAVYLKRRHDRKRDQAPAVFNEGITSRSLPAQTRDGGVGEMSYVNDSSIRVAEGLEAGSGRNTPTRTRDAFMPYGYGYSRSESRLGASFQGGMPMGELEKRASADDIMPIKDPRKRVLVRERSSQMPLNEKMLR